MKKIWCGILALVTALPAAWEYQAYAQCRLKLVVVGYPDTILDIYSCGDKPQEWMNTLDPLTGNRWRPVPDSCKGETATNYYTNFNNGENRTTQLGWYKAELLPHKFEKWNFGRDSLTQPLTTLVALYDPVYNKRPDYPSIWPKPQDIEVIYGMAVTDASAWASGIKPNGSVPGMMGRMMPPKVFPSVNDGYKWVGVRYPYRLETPEDTLCFCRYDTVVQINVLPARLQIKAKPAIFQIVQINSQSTISVPLPYTTIEDYVRTRYSLTGMPAIDNEESAFETSPYVRLQRDHSVYPNLPPGRYYNEVRVDLAEASKNYDLDPHPYPHSYVQITKINWRGYRETLVYGDTLRLDATYTSGGTNYTNQLIYSSSRSSVIEIGKQGATAWNAVIKDIGSVVVTIIFPGNTSKQIPADTAIYDISVVPYRGLSITMPIDTISVYDPAILDNFNIKGLKYNDQITRTDIRIDTKLTPASGQGTYPITVCCYTSRTYADVAYNNGSITIFKVGDSLQDVRFIRRPSSSTMSMGDLPNNRLVLWAKAVGINGPDRDKSRPLRYSSQTPNIASVIKDTIDIDSGGIIWGVIVKLNNIGTARIRAYQRGDSVYKDAEAIFTFNIEKGTHSIRWIRRPDTMSVGNRAILSSFVASTSGESAEFTTSNPRVAELRGDTLFALKKGKTKITALLPHTDNYLDAAPIDVECMVQGNFFDIRLDRETLVPDFSDSVFNYSLMLPCAEDGREEYIRMRIFYDSDVDSLYYNGIPVDPNNIATFTIASSDTAPLRFDLRNNGTLKGTYTIALKRRLPEMTAKLWPNETYSVIALNLQKLEQAGYNIGEGRVKYQWYYSISAYSRRFPLVGAIKPYLELEKLVYTTGYYNAAINLIADSVMLETCPFKIVPPSFAASARAYPNPAASSIVVENPYWQDAATIDLYNSRGALVRRYPAVGSVQTLDVAGLEAGVYLVRAGRQTIRIVIL